MDTNTPQFEEVNDEESGCPWMWKDFQAGTFEYATWASEFLQDSFGGKWFVNCTESGWFYAEEKHE